MISSRTVLPYSEYLKLPEDDHNKYEMLWGVLYVAGSPRFRHQDVQASLIELLRRHVRERRLGTIVGPIDLYRDELNYVQPDISYFTSEQVGLLEDEQAIRLVPPLVVEILSPSNASYDRKEKRRWYAELGVLEYWLVDCDAWSIEIVDLTNGTSRAEDPVRSQVLPGLSLALAEIFA